MTSQGDIGYQIQASPSPNTYRLAPIAKKVPAGVLNVRPIVVYNPHSEVCPLVSQPTLCRQALLLVLNPPDL